MREKALSFPIVALGASAGGLEAVSEFLAELPSNSEMAFVVVLHLDPGHKSLLAEIWSKRTTLPVSAISDEMIIELGHVYVIPPNTTVSIADDRFKLAPRAPGQHHPVDILFSSLAENRGDAAVAIVLSGGDSDGSLGLRAIKHSGGITFAQEPKSAQFPGMPQNAINTGCVDFVLPPADIARELGRLSVHPYLRSPPTEEQIPLEASAPSEEEQLRRVFRRLRTAHGVDFTHYKRTTLRRRLARRMAVRQLEDLSDYIKLMEDDPAEAAALHQDFLIRVTGFFRDPQVFEGLQERVFPSLCESRSPKDPIRIWVAGCASGEEVYSIAIALVEYLGDRLTPEGIQIFGTDVSEVEIERARTGFYLANISEEVSEERLRRFFFKENDHYRIAKSIRDLCIFARQDVTRDPPFSHLDLVSCRNLLIYFDARAQRHVMQVFHYALRPSGYLMLGPSETVGVASDLFELINREHRLYCRKAGSGSVAERAHRALPPLVRLKRADEAKTVEVDEDSAQQEADRLLLARYAPATLLVDEDLNILQYRGETSRFLEHASGPPSNNLTRVVRPELMVEIAPALAEARASSLSARRDGLALDDLIDVSIEVIPLRAPGSQGSILIVFEDASRRPGARRSGPARPLPESEKDRRLEQLEREMTSTRDYLQATIEGQEAVKEELKSANEEVMSANEEFQSTNEELETAKEELQSTNEELTTTNDELRDRNRELSVLNAEVEKTRGIAQRARTYADGIVATVRDPLLVLDGNLKALRANPAYYERFETTRERTEGRPFASLVGGQWNVPDLLGHIKATLATSTDVTDYEIDYASSNGLRRLLFNARKIVGDSERDQLILLAIEDVTENRAATAAILESEERFRAAIAALGGVVWTTNALGEMTGEQPAWAALTGQGIDDYQAFGWAQAMHPEDRQSNLAAWRATVLKTEPFASEHRLRRHDGEWRDFIARAVPRFDAKGALHHWVGVHTDVTELRRLARERIELLEAEQTARTQAESANRVKDEFMATLSHELRTPITIIVGWSRVLIKKYGDTNEDLRKSLDVIISNAKSQAQIISDLLDMSSIMSGKTILHLKPVDLKECVAECVTAQQLNAKERGIDLILEQAENPAVVIADQGRLQQVFGNLLTNALKFTPAGGRVTVRQHPVADTFQVSVEDTGEGIAPEFLPQVFARFRQEGHTISRQHGGLGLGLAIVKQIVEALGGSVRAESEGRGLGARFTISLPSRSATPDTELENAIEEEPDAYSSESLQGVNALVVEDNVAMLEFLLRILEERGALVIGARSASAALEALSAPKGLAFNVLVSDIGLPGMDGYELMRRIRTDVKVPAARLAAVAVTAFGRKEDRQRAFDAGYQAHLSKPYEVAHLVATLRRLRGKGGDLAEREASPQS
jgi:two-component system, chemotaxis family, CheB/CheR fusion protein